MLLCDQCHKNCGCFTLMRSRGTCEGCGQGRACVDCHAHKKLKPVEQGSIALTGEEGAGAALLAGKGYRLAKE